MNRARWYRHLAPIKGLLLFIALFIIPQQLSMLVIPGGRFSLYRTLLYSLILTAGAVLVEWTPFRLSLFPRRPASFSRMSRYPLTALKLFIAAIGLTYLINLSFFFIPLPSELVEWYKAPNPAIPQLIEYIDRGSYLNSLLMALIVTVCAPVIEEILFRGYLQSLLARFRVRAVTFRANRITVNLDIWLTALIFALFHLNSLANTLFAFIIGLYLSVYRRRSRSLVKSIAIHAFVNIIGLTTGVLLYKLFGRAYF